MKNSAEPPVSLSDIKNISIYLSKYGNTKTVSIDDSRIFVGDFSIGKSISKNTNFQIKQNEKYEFKIDLTLLRWDSFQSSVSGNGDSFNKLISGDYQLSAELFCLNAESETQSFSSNQIAVKLIN